MEGILWKGDVEKEGWSDQDIVFEVTELRLNNQESWPDSKAAMQETNWGKKLRTRLL